MPLAWVRTPGLELLPHIPDRPGRQNVDLPQPVAVGRDLLVKIKAIAVNPVDYKIRQNVSPAITGATIIATASRESSAAWVRELYRAAGSFWQDCPDRRPPSVDATKLKLKGRSLRHGPVRTCL